MYRRWKKGNDRLDTKPGVQIIKHTSVDFLIYRQSRQTHLEDVGGVGQRRGQDARHHAAEDVDDHGLI